MRLQGARVAILAENDHRYLVTYWALTKVGAIAVPLFSGYGPQAIETRLNDVNAKALFACDGFFRRGKLVWLLWAILGHACVDLVAVGLQQTLGQGLTSSLVIEAVVAVFGLMALWIIWRLRDPPVHPVSPITLQLVAQRVGV